MNNFKVFSWLDGLKILQAFPRGLFFKSCYVPYNCLFYSPLFRELLVNMSSDISLISFSCLEQMLILYFLTHISSIPFVSSITFPRLDLPVHKFFLRLFPFCYLAYLLSSLSDYHNFHTWYCYLVIYYFLYLFHMTNILDYFFVMMILNSYSGFHLLCLVWHICISCSVYFIFYICLMPFT